MECEPLWGSLLGQKVRPDVAYETGETVGIRTRLSP